MGRIPDEDIHCQIFEKYVIHAFIMYIFIVFLF